MSPSGARQAIVRHNLRKNLVRSLAITQITIRVRRDLMSGTVYTDIRESPRVLVLSRLNSIDAVVGERLLVIFARKFGLQAVNLE